MRTVKNERNKPDKMKKGKKILTGILGILAVLVLGAIIILGSIFLKKTQTGYEETSARRDIQEEASPNPAVTAAPAVTSAPEATPVPTKAPEPTPTPGPAEGLSDLKNSVEAALEGTSGTWSVYAEDLESREYLSVGSAPMKAASLIKLYIMGTVLDKVNKGELELTEEMNQLLWDMITISHNESSNELVRRLTPSGIHEDGMPVVNAFAAAEGYGDTSQGRDLQDSRDVPPPGENYTSVNDCGRFLERVYRRECISTEFSEKMEQLLLNQQRTWKIPAGLPEGVRCANKTGELSDVESDAAIVYAGEQGGRDYILCIMTQDLPDTGAAQQKIQELSALVYDYFV